MLQQIINKLENKKEFNIPGFLNAIEHWINFERLTRHSFLFSEKYLCYPIGQYLFSRYGGKVKVEKTFDRLLKDKWKGKIDFCVIIKGNPIICIETKWIKYPTSIIRIYRDIFRLSIIKKQFNKCICLFILTGEKDIVNNICNKLNFKNGKGTLTIAKNSIQKNKILKKAISGINDDGIPSSIEIIARKTRLNDKSDYNIKVKACEIVINKNKNITKNGIIHSS